MIRKILVMILAIFLSQSQIEAKSVDWIHTNIISAVGIGSFPDVGDRKKAIALARRAAIVDAERALTEKIFEILSPRDDNLSFGSRRDEDQNSFIIINEQLDGDDYLIELGIHVYGENSLSARIIPKILAQIGNKSVTRFENLPSENDVTGLILDCRGADLDPKLFPSVYDPDENLILGIQNVDRNIAIDRGIVSYSEDLVKARKDPRVGQNPIVIQPYQISNDLEIILTHEDSQKILRENRKSHFIENCAVIILID